MKTFLILWPNRDVTVAVCATRREFWEMMDEALGDPDSAIQCCELSRGRSVDIERSRSGRSALGGWHGPVHWMKPSMFFR